MNALPASRHAAWWLIVPAALLAIGLGALDAQSQTYSLVAVAAVVALLSLTIVSHRMRAREIALWMLVLVSVFNFTPALFTPENLNQEPLWQKGVKDLPVILLVLIGLVTAGERWSLPKPLSRLTFTLGGLTLSLAIVMVADLLFRGAAIASFLVSFRYYVLYPTLALVVVLLRPRRYEIERLARGIALLGALEGALAVANCLGLVGNTFYQGYVHIGGNQLARAIATLGNPNNLGLFLGLPAVLLLAGGIFPPWPRRLLLALITAGMAVTFSKTVAGAYLIAIFALAFIQQRGMLRFRVIGGIVVVAAFAYLTITGRLEGNLTTASVLGGRTQSYPAAFGLWLSGLQHFFVGQGYGSLAANLGNTVNATLNIDSMPLFLAVEGGVVALLLFAAIVIQGMRIVIAAWKLERSPLTDGLLAYTIFFLVYSPATTNFRLFPGSLFFWIAVGLTSALAGQGAAVQKQTQPLPSARRGALAPS